MVAKFLGKDHCQTRVDVAPLVYFRVKLWCNPGAGAPTSLSFLVSVIVEFQNFKKPTEAKAWHSWAGLA